MTGQQALLEKLRGDAVDAETIDEALRRQQGDWLRDLETLMDTIDGWLSEGKAEGLWRVERRTVELAEEDLGAYAAPAVSIHARTAHPRTVKVEPRGMRVAGVVIASDRRIVGARGRVDVTCGAGRAILLRMAPGMWKLVPPSGVQTELTNDSFSATVAELLE